MTPERHYSNKGGHKIRSEYWSEVRKVTPHNEPVVKVEPCWLIRRSMNRPTKEGKK